ncbi:MAG: DNA-3-methyladenine glycosylase 2 family protein [Acidobacteriota bacterium]|nr:DNA-3-methyladenine glycosylase 2 family protein [Acidobacteriota bacterium]
MTSRFAIRPTSPFRLDLTAWTLRRSLNNRIDDWDGTTYRRVLTLGPRAVAVSVRQERGRLEVVAQTAGRVPGLEEGVSGALEQMLGLRTDLQPFDDLAAHDRQLRALVDRFRGVRPPRFPTVFEGLLNAISCQQLSLAAGLTILSRLSARFGLAAADGDRHACPRPEDLARRRSTSIRTAGYSQAKARALLAAARAALRGTVDLEGLTAADEETALARLRALPGVGRWTAEYVLLRSLGRLNVFPANDVGAAHGLRRWLGVRRPLGYDDVRRLLEPWRPWAGLVYFHLLLDGLDRAGLLKR